MKKIFLILFSIIALTLFTSQNVYSQGTCTCTPSRVIRSCSILGSSNCNSGFVPTCSNAQTCTGISCTCLIAPTGGVVGGGPEPTGCGGALGFETAIGCIPVESPQDFAEFFLRWAIGIAGGIALALIGYAGLTIMSSSGNPQKLQAGKEVLNSAIMGLALILFGVFALRFVGVDILQIPGFGT